MRLHERAPDGGRRYRAQRVGRRRRVHAVNGDALALQWKRDGEWRRDDGRVWCGTASFRLVTRPQDGLADAEKLTCRTCRRVLLRFVGKYPDVRTVLETAWSIRDGVLR